MRSNVLLSSSVTEVATKIEVEGSQIYVSRLSREKIRDSHNDILRTKSLNQFSFTRHPPDDSFPPNLLHLLDPRLELILGLLEISTRVENVETVPNVHGEGEVRRRCFGTWS